MDDKRIVNLSVKAFMSAVYMLIGLMILTYVLTLVLPSGEFDRELSESGQTIIVSGTYHLVEGGIPLWKWLLSPFLLFTGPGSFDIAAICVFLIVIGGAIMPLDECGCMRYMLDRIANRFRARKYTLLAVTSLFFMALGSIIGSFEDAVPLVPVVIALSYSMGWDALVGLGMSLLSLGFGFSTGICNIYTVGIAQRLAGVPLFSGIWLRIVSFVLIYLLTVTLLTRYAKKIDTDPKKSLMYSGDSDSARVVANTDFVENEKLKKSVRWFTGIIGTGLVLIILTSVIPFLQDIITGVMALVFLAAGTVASFTAGMKAREFFKHSLKGIVSVLPGVGMILIAGSVKYTLVEAKTMDTVLNFAVDITKDMTPFFVVLIIYALVLVMNFFIASASAKSFLMIPLIVPLAQMNGVTPQLSILAFLYGDGFSNVFYPTNPVLLICLGLVGVKYMTWMKFSIKFQLGILGITCALLLVGRLTGYS